MSDLLAKIKAADKQDLKEVDVPEWGIKVYIRQLTVGERDSLESEVYNNKATGNALDNMRSRFLARVMCDEKGKPLCKPNEFEQIANLSARPMERIFEAAQAHCRLDGDAIETTAKN